MSTQFSTSGISPVSKKATVLRFLLLATLILLAIQYLLGIYVNVYIAAPYRGPIFNSHYSVGLLLVALAIVILVVSALTRSVRAIATSVMALIFIIAAGQAGRLFSYYGQDPVYSVVMALGFLLAFASYFSEVLIVRRMITNAKSTTQPQSASGSS